MAFKVLEDEPRDDGTRDILVRLDMGDEPEHQHKFLGAPSDERLKEMKMTLEEWVRGTLGNLQTLASNPALLAAQQDTFNKMMAAATTDAQRRAIQKAWDLINAGGM